MTGQTARSRLPLLIGSAALLAPVVTMPARAAMAVGPVGLEGQALILAQGGPPARLPLLDLPPSTSTVPPMFAFLIQMGDTAMVRGDIMRAPLIYERAAMLTATAQQKLFAGIEEQVQYITKLYDEDVHVFAGPVIERLEDLAGKLVSMDNRSSGTAMTATLLFSQLGIAIQPVYDATVDATEQLRRGDIAAMARVTGKPVRFTTPLPGGAKLLSVSLSDTLLETYLPASFSAADYPGLVPAGQTVDTIAVGAVLAAYNHQNAERRDRLVRFSRALALKYDTSLRPPRHPKWRDVILAATVPGWTKFGSQLPRPPAQPPRRFRIPPEMTGG